jgi:hypothetical protein
MKKVLIFFIIGFLPISFVWPDIYYQNKISAYRLLQTTSEVLAAARGVLIESESWLQSDAAHVRLIFKSLINQRRDFKIEGRMSFSSLSSRTRFSLAEWVNFYYINGSPFSWSETNKQWNEKFFEFNEKNVRDILNFRLLQNLFYIKAENMDFKTLQFLGEEQNNGKDCFVLQFKPLPEVFSRVKLVGDVLIKLWVDKTNFQPVFAHIQGKIGEMLVAQTVTYGSFGQLVNLNAPREVLSVVDQRRQAFKQKLIKLPGEIIRFRGWPARLFKDIKFKFVSAKQLSELAKEKLNQQYFAKDILGEEKILKWLNIISDDVDFTDFLIKTQLGLLPGVYLPKEKTIFLADWLGLDLAQAVCAYAIVSVFQQQALPQDDSFNKAANNPDNRLAKDSFFRGEALAVSLEYLLRQDKETFKTRRNIANLLDNVFFHEIYPNKIFYELYGYGIKFIRGYLAKHDWPALNQIYKVLPISTREIMNVSNYLMKEDSRYYRRDDSWLIEPVLPDGWQTISSGALGEYIFLSSLNSILDADISASASRGWRNDQFKLYENAQGNNLFFVLTLWENEEDAQEFFKAYKQWWYQRGYDFFSRKIGEFMFIQPASEKKVVFKLDKERIIIVATDNLGKDEFNLITNNIFSLLLKDKKI